MLKKSEFPEPEEDSGFRGLHTLLPTEVHEELKAFAKSRRTATGSWDYGVAIRELLFVHGIHTSLMTRIDDLETNQAILLDRIEKRGDVPQKKEEGCPGLLGRRKEDGTD